MKSKASLRGRPRDFPTPKDLEVKIDRYFASITRTIPKTESKLVGYEDKAKKKPIYEEIPVLDNDGNQVIVTEWFKPPTITGLCLFLEITDEGLREYGRRENYSGIVKRAKKIIENRLQEAAYNGDYNTTFTIFNLKCNFGYKEPSQETVNKNINYNVDAYKDLEDSELDKIITQLMSEED